MDTAIPIPTFPDSRPMELTDKPLLDRLFADLQPRISEFTFAGLYLFRNAHSYRMTTVGNSLVLLGCGYGGGNQYFLPPLSGRVEDALTELFTAGFTLYGADEAFADRYLTGEGLEVAEDRDSFDYLYLRNELAELPGNRYHKKKNRVNYFAKRHSYVIELFTENHVEGCLQLNEEWQQVRISEENLSAGPEAAATAEGLRLAGELGLDGVVAIIEGRVKGFALGERLNHETSVCHFEKSDAFIEGISQLVDQEFNRRLFTDCIFVNREQDLGEPGLRAAKLSYHPTELVKKYRARFRVG